jgi:hypothetical protein
MGKIRNSYKFWSGTKRKAHMEHFGVDGRITLKRDLKKCGVKVENEINWLKIRFDCTIF